AEDGIRDKLVTGVQTCALPISKELAKDPGGRPHRIAAGPYPQSLFYAATGTYDAMHTCNTWTAEGLQIAGLPVSAAGIVFADQRSEERRVGKECGARAWPAWE